MIDSKQCRLGRELQSIVLEVTLDITVVWAGTWASRDTPINHAAILNSHARGQRELTVTEDWPNSRALLLQV